MKILIFRFDQYILPLLFSGDLVDISSILFYNVFRFLACFLIRFLPSKDVFFKYELASYEHLISSIEAQPNAAVREVLEWFLRKIHCRQKWPSKYLYCYA